MAANSLDGNVVRLNPQLQPVGVLGRPGSGPGEFANVYDAAPLPAGGVVAIDPGHHRVTFFSQSGEYSNAFRLESQDPRKVTVLGGTGLLLIAGITEMGTKNHLLALYDSLGRRTQSFLTADPRVFETNLMVDAPFVSIADDGRYYAGLEMLPDVHLVDASGDVICSVREAPPGWEQLEVPERQFSSLAAATEWVSSATIGHGAAWVSNLGLLRNYTVKEEQPRTRLQLYGRNLQLLEQFTGVPGRLVGARADTIFLLEQTPDSMFVSGYTHVGRATLTP